MVAVAVAVARLGPCPLLTCEPWYELVAWSRRVVLLEEELLDEEALEEEPKLSHKASKEMGESRLGKV